MMQSSESYLGEQFLRSEYGEQEQENQMVKTKTAPLREGPNWNNAFQDTKLDSSNSNVQNAIPFSAILHFYH